MESARGKPIACSGLARPGLLSAYSRVGQHRFAIVEMIPQQSSVRSPSIRRPAPPGIAHRIATQPTRLLTAYLPVRLQPCSGRVKRGASVPRVGVDPFVWIGVKPTARHGLLE